MKLKDGFVLRKVGGQVVVLPMNADLDLNKMIKLNETGAFLWERLERETDEAALVSALLAEYDLLLLDEPYKGLDEDTRRQVAAVVQRLTEGKTLLMVTHEPDDTHGHHLIELNSEQTNA